MLQAAGSPLGGHGADPGHDVGRAPGIADHRLVDGHQFLKIGVGPLQPAAGG